MKMLMITKGVTSEYFLTHTHLIGKKLLIFGKEIKALLDASVSCFLCKDLISKTVS